MPGRSFLSSGDLVADRRYEFARDLQMRGDLAAAAELLEQAIELAPYFVAAWFVLGEIRQQQGAREAAITGFRAARAADPQDRHGAGLHLMQLGAEGLSDMPKAYVQALFDQYARRFDNAVLGELGYRGPSLLLKAVLLVRAAARSPAVFKRAIDLGCGTGLGAAAFAENVERFTGIDLSPGMVEQALASGRYARLEVDDMLSGLRHKGDGSADLIIAADAMVYVRDLAPVIAQSTRVLAGGGVLAFTVETHDGDGVIIGEGLRYAHAASHVRAIIEAAGLTLSALQTASTRNEGNVPVPGLVVVATKP